MTTVNHDSYAAAGVDTLGGGAALSGLIAALSSIDTGRPSRSLVPNGHYASVIDIDLDTAIALCTDGVGTKLIVAEQAKRFDTVGIDCVAMCVNDLICVGAEPLALVDYIAVESTDASTLEQIGRGLKRGAELAGIEIPGGELAQLPEVIRGHPSPGGIDLVGSAFGRVNKDRIITGADIGPGDAIIGLPSTGLHSNGYTLARRVLLDSGAHSLDQVVDQLLEPTAIYVAPVLELLGSGIAVHGLAHITGDGVANLLRLNPAVGFEIDDPLEPQPIFELISSAGGLSGAEMHQVFNMGTGFCCVVGTSDEIKALEILQRHHPTARRIGKVTGEAGTVALPFAGVVGNRDGLREA